MGSEMCIRDRAKLPLVFGLGRGGVECEGKIMQCLGKVDSFFVRKKGGTDRLKIRDFEIAVLRSDRFVTNGVLI